VTGPPNERESRPAGNEAASTTPGDSKYSDPDDIDPYDNPDPTPPPGWASPLHYCQSLPSQLGRRREAARRSVPLDCGCRDPLPCNCTQPPISSVALDGWRDAALHVLSVGQLPLLPIEVRRSLYRRGGPDRVLAEKLHEACGGEVT